MHMIRAARTLSAALVILAAAAMPAAAATFSSGVVNKRIPEVGVAVSKIKVDANSLSDLNVKVRLSHSYTPDLTIGVLSPGKNGEFTELFAGWGTDNDNNLGLGSKSCSGTFTTFDDEGDFDLSEGVNPYAASFRPDEALDEYDDGRVKGTWRLYVFDTNQDDDGTLHCWQLRLQS